MDEFFARALSQMWGRMSGPFHLRFILQPLMASLLAVRAGLKDARAHRSAYFHTLLTNPAQRHTLIREGAKDVSKIFLVAFVVDVVYQIVVLDWYYPVQALLVALVLAVIPYVSLRGPTARIASHGRWSSSTGKDEKAA